MCTPPERSMHHRENRDGRVARGERTRWAVVEAHAELLRDGVLRPTAKLISERAGISIRTLWLNFGDMEALMAVTGQYWLDRDARSWMPVDADLPLPDRIEQWCDQRARRMEDLAPAAASALLVEPFSASLTATRRIHRSRLHRDLAATFGAEIGPGIDSASASPVHLALFVAADGITWLVLRRDEGLSYEASIDLMRQTFTRLLTDPGSPSAEGSRDQ